MRGDLFYTTRRQVLLGTLSAGALAFFVPGVFAGHLDATPAVEEGPFYPYKNMPLDTDNDLILVSNSVTPAVGEITHLGGRVLDGAGRIGCGALRGGQWFLASARALRNSGVV